MKFMIVIQVLILFVLFGGIMFGVYSCSSWVTSGHMGKDIGSFGKDVKDGFEGKPTGE